MDEYSVATVKKNNRVQARAEESSSQKSLSQKGIATHNFIVSVDIRVTIIEESFVGLLHKTCLQLAKKRQL